MQSKKLEDQLLSSGLSQAYSVHPSIHFDFFDIAINLLTRYDLYTTMRLQSVSTVAAILLGNGCLVIASKNASLPTQSALGFDSLATKLPTVSIQAAASRTLSADFLAAVANGKLPISNKTTIASTNAFDASRNCCPAISSKAGIVPANWTVYHDTNRLSACNEDMFLDFAVHNCLDDPETQVRIRACTADANTDVQSVSQSTTAASCIYHNNTAPLQATLQLGHWQALVLEVLLRY